MRSTGDLTARAVVLGALAAALVGATQSADAGGAEVPLRGVAYGDAQQPAADADIAVGILGWAPGAGEHVDISRTAEDGRFALLHAPLGPVDVWVRPRGGSWTFGLRMLQPGVPDVVIDARAKPALPGGLGVGPSEEGELVKGVVKDSRGKALAGAAVCLRGDDATWVTTGADGAFEIAGGRKGDGVIARADGYRDALAEFTSTKRAVSLKLTPAKPTLVRVTGPDGQPFEKAYVVLGDPDRVLGTTGFTSLFPPRERLVGGWTDAKGEVRLHWGHTEDETVATAYATGCAPARAEIVAGKPAAVTLELAPAQPAVAVLTYIDGGAPVANVYLGLPSASDGGGDAVSALPAAQERGPIVVGRTDADGRCEIPHLDPAVTELRIVADIVERRRMRVVIERPAKGGTNGADGE